MTTVVEKVLSPNDIGLTGSHQAGILIPKQGELLHFFPNLDSSLYNPRAVLNFTDIYGVVWKFNYIYYNSRLRGGTRNEYRLTGMTKYLRSVDAAVGDILVFEKNADEYQISLIKQSDSTFDDQEDVVLVLKDNNWKVYNF